MKQNNIKLDERDEQLLARFEQSKRDQLKKAITMRSDALKTLCRNLASEIDCEITSPAYKAVCAEMVAKLYAEIKQLDGDLLDLSRHDNKI